MSIVTVFIARDHEPRLFVISEAAKIAREQGCAAFVWNGRLYPTDRRPILFDDCPAVDLVLMPADAFMQHVGLR